jgi:hypothetical protein
VALDTARLVRPGENFVGLSFARLASAGTGRIIAGGQGGGRLEAGSTDSCQSDQRRR